MIKLNAYSNALKETDERVTKFHLLKTFRFLTLLQRILKSSMTPFRALFSLKPFQKVKTLFNRINPLNKVSFGVLFVFWLVVITIVILAANKLRYNFFVDLITKNFPEAVIVPADSAGRPLYMSALDRMFGEFDAMVNVGYLVIFAVYLMEFESELWFNLNRKPQVFKRV